MADRPRAIDQRFQGVNLRLNYRLKGYFSRHCDMTQFTLTHHMVIKPFLLLGLAAEYRSRRWMWSTLPPTIRCLWHSPANLSWQRLRRSAVDFYSKNEKIALWATFSYLGVTHALHLWLVGKPVVDFIFVVIELFSLSPTAVSYTHLTLPTILRV